MHIIIKNILHNMQVGKFDIIYVEFLFHTEKAFQRILRKTHMLKI